MHLTQVSTIKRVLEALFLPMPKTVLVTGPILIYRWALRLAARIARQRRVVYLDGANRFDPYELVRYAEERNLSEEALLRSVFVRRAFTCYQMYEMVARVPVARMIGGRLVLVIADPCLTFFDESVARAHAERLFRRMIGCLAPPWLEEPSLS